MARTPSISIIERPIGFVCLVTACAFLTRVLLCTRRSKSAAHWRTTSKPLIRLRFSSYSGVTDSLSRVSKEECSEWILGINPRMTFKVWLRMLVLRSLHLSSSGLSRVSKEECSEWILGINPRMTESKWERIFRSDSNFFKKWQKPRVEALKRSEIECLGFTERERETFAELIFHLSFLFKVINFVENKYKIISLTYC